MDQTEIVERLKTARKNVTGLSPFINGLFVHDVLRIQHNLDKLIEDMTKFIDRNRKE